MSLLATRGGGGALGEVPAAAPVERESVRVVGLQRRLVRDGQHRDAEAARRALVAREVTC